DYRLFSRRAYHLLNVLAAQLHLLPEQLAITNVFLLSAHPVKHGGFSAIYHGRYENDDGKEVEFALKVLKMFDDQPEERRHLPHRKFTQEALVWNLLKHKNIVPFLGVDSTTFPSPARAMVSPWMAKGNVLAYIAENSPVAPYALKLLNDVIAGLSYLHSTNIIHGDLCGRNILIDERGTACLSDFGLAGLVESEPTLRSSTRGGSIRWMPPELLSPPSGVSFTRTTASDIWAFGCVCGEVCTRPFSHFSHDTGIILAFSDPKGSAEEQPYHRKLLDKRGTPMPDRLWALAQRCWKNNPSERPAGNVIADTL
ncbi:kinase-like domain-containing protein, partial [Mycena olivaceomarginata]